MTKEISSRSRIEPPRVRRLGREVAIKADKPSLKQKSVRIKTDQPKIVQFNSKDKTVLQTTAKTNITLQKLIMAYDKGRIFANLDGLSETVRGILRDEQILKETAKLSVGDLQKIIAVLQENLKKHLKKQFKSPHNFKHKVGEVKPQINRLETQENAQTFLKEVYLEIDNLKAQIAGLSRVDNRLMKLKLRDLIAANPDLYLQRLYKNALDYLEESTPKISTQSFVATSLNETVLEANIAAILRNVARIIEVEEKLTDPVIDEHLKVINSLQNDLKEKQAEAAKKLNEKPRSGQFSRTVYRPPSFSKSDQSKIEESKARTDLLTRKVRPESQEKSQEKSQAKSQARPKTLSPTIQEPPKKLTRNLLPATPLSAPIIRPTPIKLTPRIVNRPPAFFSAIEAVSGTKTLQTRLAILNSPSLRGLKDSDKNGKNALEICAENSQISSEDKARIIELLQKRMDSQLGKIDDKLKPEIRNLGKIVEETVNKKPRPTPTNQRVKQISPPKIKDGGARTGSW